MAASPKQQLVAALKDERARTTRALRLPFPSSASEFRPHATSQAAREIVHTLCVEALIGTAALDGSLDMKKLNFPAPPPTWSDVLEAFHGSYDKLSAALDATPDTELAATMTFMVGPKQLGEVPKGEIVRFMLNDHIHHRGQLSVYLRMSGGKVPSIYGPSKDEPWM